MNTHPNEPLSPEEQELAQLMARLGPTGEPSPALDAKILAAAHSAATREPARKRKPRWPVAMGLAASVVFAVGIAWQLRPVQQVATVHEAPVTYSVADAPDAEAPASAAAAPVVAADAVAKEDVSTETVRAEPAFAPPPLAQVAAPPVQSVRQPSPRSASPPLPARKTAPPTERAEARPIDAYAAPSSPPAPPPPQVMSAPAPSTPQVFADESEAGAVADAAVATEVAASSARGLNAKQSAARGEMKAANAAAAREQDSTTLDRVEVTGSRLRRTDLQVPVSDDAQLAVDDWLERVRTRYGLGDADAARQSLLLFVKDHPSETVPEDLEPLLDE